MTKASMARCLVLCGLLVHASAVSAQVTVSADRFRLTPGPCAETSGSGSPEGVITGNLCDRYIRTNGAGNTTIYVKTSGSGNTGWLPLTITGSALTKTDDANVTLTLGGAPTTALFNAASLTLGWIGTLSVPRGGTGAGSFTANGVVYGNGTSAFGVTAQGPANSVLTANAGAPSFSANPTVTTLTTTSDATLNGNTGTSSFVSQTTGWRCDSGGRCDMRYGYFDEMRVKLFTADLEAVLAGSRRVVKSYSTLSQPFTCPALAGASTLWVKDSATFGDAAVFVSGDDVVIHNMTRTVFGPFTISDCVGVVTSYTDGTGGNAGTQSWTFTRHAAGTGTDGGSMTASTTVPVDVLVQDFGVTGNGYIEDTAIDGSGGINSPYTQVVTWATAPTAAHLTTRARIGNLRGITGTLEYGAMLGTYGTGAAKYLIASDVTGLEAHNMKLSLFDGSTETVRLDPAAPSFALGSTLPSAYGTGTGIWMGKDSGAYKFRVGNPSGNRLSYDGDLTLVSAQTSIDSSGITITPASSGTGSAVASYKFTTGGSFVLGTSAWDYTGNRGTILEANGENTGKDTYVVLLASNTGGAANQAEIQLSVPGSGTDTRISISAPTLNLTADAINIPTTAVTLAGVYSAGSLFVQSVAGIVDIGQVGTGAQTVMRFFNANNQIGSISVNGTTTSYNTTSDDRLKDNIRVVRQSDVLRDLVVHDFTWKDTRKADRGIFAQEAAVVKADAITPGSDDVDAQGKLLRPWMVDYSKFVPDLIAGWQQHEDRLDAIEAAIKALQ